MKRMVMLLALALLLAATPAFASADLDEALFETAKQTLALLSYGEYDDAYTLANFAEGTLSKEDFSSLADEGFDTLFSGTIQRDVAVAYYDGQTWRVAVPLEQPTDRHVEVIVFTSADGSRFDGCEASRWGKVTDAVDESEIYLWCEAYQRSEPAVLPDAP